MASSGWQGEQTLNNYGGGFVWKADLWISSITHNSSSVTISGRLQLCARSGSGSGTNCVWYNYGVNAKPMNGSWMELLGAGDSMCRDDETGDSVGNFTVTIPASASDTSLNFTAEYRACYDNDCNSSTAYWSVTPSWTINFDRAYVAPSGAGVRFNSATWNTVNITSTVSNWGSGYTDTPHLQQIVCLPDSTASNWYQRGRLVHDNRTTAKTSTGTVTNSDQAYNGGLTIKGASNYKVACWASTTVGESHALSSVVRTPPAPLASFTKVSETRGATAVATVFRIVGGSSTNNSANNVVTQYRLSTNGGSTYGNWTNVGSAATAYTAKDLTLNIPYSSNVSIQARQYYNSDTNATAAVTLTYTALGPVAPSNLTVTVNSKTWNSANLTGSIDSYGYPSAASGRKINVGLATSNSAAPDGLEVQTANATSATVTVDQSSYIVRNGFTFKGMMTLYPYTYATNTLANDIVFGNAEVLPPAPGQLSYSIDPNNISQQTIAYVGVAANNDANYDPTLLKRTVRYADVSDPTNWTYIENDSVVALTTATTQTIAVGAQHTITVEAWMTYDGNQSEVSTIQLTNSSALPKLYCSYRGETKKIVHLYAPVNGATKKLTKLYASVNGVAKLIHED